MTDHIPTTDGGALSQQNLEYIVRYITPSKGELRLVDNGARSLAFQYGQYTKVLDKAPKWDAPAGGGYAVSDMGDKDWAMLLQSVNEYLPCQSCDEGKGCRCGDE